MDYEHFWRSLKASKKSTPLLENGNEQATVASFQLQNDLTKLLNAIIPSSNVSLTDLIGLLGYSHSFEIDDLSAKTTVSKTTALNCSSYQELTDPVRKNYDFLNNLHPLHGLDPIHSKYVPCDLEMYSERWKDFLKTLNKTTKNESIKMHNGN